MDIYRIEWKSSAVREIKRLDRKVVARIVAAVDGLSSEPFPVGAKKLRGGNITYRIRVGDYRVVYDVFAGQLIIEIIRVRHRKDAYRKK
jgi:mRNA interferase RelE/StbE